MQVRVFEYTELTSMDFERINSMSIHLSIYEQLWYVAPLADFKLTIYVFGDFETIFFVPYRSKLMVKYVYMPNFIQKLSFIGKVDGVDQIINLLTNRIKFGEISIINHENRFDSNKERTNILLDLENSYVELKKNFSDNHKRNISKVKHIEIRQSENIDDLISIFKAEKVDSFRLIELNKIENDLNRILTYNKLKDRIFIINAYEYNHIIASALFIHFNNVLHYIIGSSLKSNPKFSSKGLFRIFDFVINRFSGTNTKLDFEGSDIPGIARFFKGFGSQEETYYFVNWNRLPFPLNKLKK
jgi:hypothetical protein